MDRVYYEKSRSNGWSDSQIREMSGWNDKHGPDYGRLGDVFVMGKSPSADMQNSVSGGGLKMKIDFYGAPADLNAGRGILGDLGNYIDTTGWSIAQMLSIPQGSYILGGIKAGGGVSVDVPGATRIYGDDVQSTASKILQFATGGLFVPRTGPNSEFATGILNIPRTQPITPPSGGLVGPSPSADTMNAIAQANGNTIGLNGTSTSVLSGLTFDNMIGVFVGIAFISAIMGIFKKG